MKTKKILTALFLILLSGCSTQKNSLSHSYLTGNVPYQSLGYLQVYQKTDSNALLKYLTLGTVQTQNVSELQQQLQTRLIQTARKRYLADEVLSISFWQKIVSGSKEVEVYALGEMVKYIPNYPSNSSKAAA